MDSPIEENTQDLSNVSRGSFVAPAPFLEPYWIISQLVLSIVTVITVYVFVCLVKFGVRTGCKPGHELRGKQGRLLFQTVLVSVSMTIGRCISDQMVSLIGWQSDDKCKVTVSISFVFYSLALYPVYIFLWFRQSIFYASPVLASVLNPVVTVFSWMILVGMVTGGAIITIFFVLPEITGWNYAASESGCRDISDESDFEVIPAVLLCFTIFIQICLLALFIYPLISKKTLKYRESRKKTSTPNRMCLGSEANVENSSNIFTNDPDEVDTNPNALEGNVINEGLTTPDSSSVKETKPIENEDLTPTDSYTNNSGVLYRNKNTGTLREKSTKASQKSKTLSLTNQVKRGINWSVVTNGSYRTKKRRSSKTQQGRRVMRFIRKAFFLALICVVSDVVFTVIQLIVVVPELVYLVLFDVNLLINIICIILSFRNWPKMILPHCYMNLQKYKQTASENTKVTAFERERKLQLSLPLPNSSPGRTKSFNHEQGRTGSRPSSVGTL